MCVIEKNNFIFEYEDYKKYYNCFIGLNELLKWYYLIKEMFKK